MLSPSLFPILGTAAFLLLNRLKTGRKTMTKLINELKAAHARITNKTDAIRLSNEIGIALLEAFTEHVEETRAQERDDRLAAARRIRDRDAESDALIREVNEREAARDETMNEIVRLLRVLAGEAPPATEVAAPPSSPAVEALCASAMPRNEADEPAGEPRDGQ